MQPQFPMFYNINTCMSREKLRMIYSIYTYIYIYALFHEHFLSTLSMIFKQNIAKVLSFIFLATLLNSQHLQIHNAISSICSAIYTSCKLNFKLEKNMLI